MSPDGAGNPTDKNESKDCGGHRIKRALTPLDSAVVPGGEGGTDDDSNAEDEGGDYKETMTALTPLPSDFVPGPFDVVCGRGKTIFNSTGNRRYRVLIDMYLQKYADSASKVEKSIVVSSIVESIEESSPQGGFVKKLHGKWYKVGDYTAREKVGQSLRNLLQNKHLSSTKRQRRDCEEGSSIPPHFNKNQPNLTSKEEQETIGEAPFETTAAAIKSADYPAGGSPEASMKLEDTTISHIFNDGQKSTNTYYVLKEEEQLQKLHVPPTAAGVVDDAATKQPLVSYFEDFISFQEVLCKQELVSKIDDQETSDIPTTDNTQMKPPSYKTSQQNIQKPTSTSPMEKEGSSTADTANLTTMQASPSHSL